MKLSEFIALLQTYAEGNFDPYVAVVDPSSNCTQSPMSEELVTLVVQGGAATLTLGSVYVSVS